MGKKDSGASNTGANEAAEASAEIARQLFGESAPLREGVLGRSTDFIQNGDVYASPQYGALKSNTEAQYGRARDNIIGSSPAGGALSANLGNLEAARVSDLTQGTAALTDNELARAYGLSTGNTSGALQGYGTAGGIQANLANSQAQQNAGKAGALGAGAGSYFGSK